ncbi:MAG: NAD(P)-dependent oxidoreductase, partial [Paracoccaceae bacterium]
APLAHSRTVGILGLGELGRRSARYLLAAGFNVCGWSRRLKSEPGVACYSGETGLKEVLGRSDYLVLLLPLTEETEGILGGENLAMLPKGAVVLNPGRGSLIRDEALLDALGDGRLRHAVLDVFRTEPLAPGHPYWAHPRVTVTPHIASATRPETASDTIAENIRRGEAGEPFLYLVDRGAGY